MGTKKLTGIYNDQSDWMSHVHLISVTREWKKTHQSMKRLVEVGIKVMTACASLSLDLNVFYNEFTTHSKQILAQEKGNGKSMEKMNKNIQWM